MSKEVKESKEEIYNAKQLNTHYDATKYCPRCGVKLAIDGSCGSFICGGK